MTRLINRLEVRGGAGSRQDDPGPHAGQGPDARTGGAQAPAGGAALLLDRARRSTSSGSSRRCAAQAPARLRRVLRGPRPTRGASRPTTTARTADFWERELAAQMAEVATGLPEGKRFDAIIVDEAQDFADHWWHPLHEGAQGRGAGGLYVYSDENQRIFARYGQPPVPLVPLVLDHNLRNTRQIAERLRPARADADDPARWRWPRGRCHALSPARRRSASRTTQVERAPRRGLAPGAHRAADDGVTSPSAEGAARRRDGQVGYWRSFWENDDVFYGHVLGCKGLERKAVVLCVNTEQADRGRGRSSTSACRARRTGSSSSVIPRSSGRSGETRSPSSWASELREPPWRAGPGVRNVTSGTAHPGAARDPGLREDGQGRSGRSGRRNRRGCG